MLTLGWSWLDPVTALLVGVVVAAGAFALLRDSFNATMDAVPDSVDQIAVRAFLGAQPGVSAVHHLHIWALGSDEVAMTAIWSRSEEHTSELQSLMRISYAVFCLKKNITQSHANQQFSSSNNKTGSRISLAGQT